MAVVAGQITYLGGKTHTFQATVTVNWQDIASNKSSIHVEVHTIGAGGVYSVWGSATGYSVTNGSQYNFSVTVNASGWTLCQAYDMVVAHDADGKKSFTVSGAINVAGLATGSFGGTVTLPTIPRASSISISSATPIGYVGGPAHTINISRASSSFTHTIQFWRHSSSSLGSAAIATIATKTTATSVSYAIPLSYAAAFPTSMTTTAFFRCITYSESTQIGVNDLVVYPKIPTDMIPTMGAITATDSQSYLSTIGAYIQGYSQLVVGGLDTAAGIQGSTIQSWIIRVGTVTTTTTTSGDVTITLTQANTTTPLSVGVIAVDGRGQQSAESLLSGGILVLPYTAPTALQNDNTYAERADSLTVPNQTATKVRVSVHAQVSSLTVNNVQKNKRTVVLKAKLATATTYSANSPVTIENSNPITTQTISKITTYLLTSVSGISSFDPGLGYTIQISVTDAITTTVKELDVPASKTALSIGVDGIGVGKTWYEGALDVKGNSQIEGNLTVTGDTVVDGDLNVIDKIYNNDIELTSMGSRGLYHGVWGLGMYISNNFGFYAIVMLDPTRAYKITYITPNITTSNYMSYFLIIEDDVTTSDVGFFYGPQRGFITGSWYQHTITRFAKINTSVPTLCRVRLRIQGLNGIAQVNSTQEYNRLLIYIEDIGPNDDILLDGKY